MKTGLSLLTFVLGARKLIIFFTLVCERLPDNAFGDYPSDISRRRRGLDHPLHSLTIVVCQINSRKSLWRANEEEDAKGGNVKITN